LSDPSAMGRLGKRHARLRHVVSVADRVDQLRADVEAAEDLTEEDPAFGLEAERLRGQLDLASTELTELLAPSDPLDQEDALV
ncbi:PCRF domain-containing protein, partial [Listeria monocytogenes]|nr:PCRF domain-containing protein [Listeria monocytogenes]